MAALTLEKVSVTLCDITALCTHFLSSGAEQWGGGDQGWTVELRLETADNVFWWKR